LFFRVLIKKPKQKKRNKIYRKWSGLALSLLIASQALAPSIALFFVFIKGADNMSSTSYFSKEKKNKNDK